MSNHPPQSPRCTMTASPPCHAQRAGRWWTRDRLTIHFDPRAQVGESGDLLVGIGHSPDESRFVALNHKTAGDSPGRLGFVALSVSECVLNASRDLQTSWRRTFPGGITSVRRIVVEDASLDTCMALLLFAQAIAGDAKDVKDAEHDLHVLGAVQTHGAGNAEAEQRLNSWVSYVTAWEQGRYPDGEDYRRSAACLMTALAHSRLPSGKPSATGAVIDDASVAAALRGCLTLLDAYIAANAEAVDALPPRDVPESVQAQAQLGIERQLYDAALKHGVQTQLLLPVQGCERKLLVDALIVEDIEIAGLLKIFARNDHVNSKTGRGFALLALHRPQAAGTGNDMVISVDPDVGVALAPLWKRLEELEDCAWGSDRPRDNPRRGIGGYTDPKTGNPLPGAPDQPWYDEGGRCTLVAAPKSLLTGAPGSRLSWKEDVLPALWDVFQPFESPRHERYPATAGRLIVARVEWPRGTMPQAEGLPVLHQWMATCSSPETARQPGDFPPLANLCARSVPGGEVIAHPGGVTLSDDWSSTRLDPSLIGAARAMAEVAGRYEAILTTERLAGLAEDLKAVLAARGRAGERHLLDLRRSALALKQELIELGVQEEHVHRGAGHRALLEALEQAWDLPDARHRLWETVAHIEELLEQAQQVHQAKTQFLMTKIVSAAGAFVFVHELIGAVANVMTMNEFERLAIVAGQIGVGPEKIAELQHNAQLSDNFDMGVIAAAIGIFAGAATWAWLRYRGADRAANIKLKLKASDHFGGCAGQEFLRTPGSPLRQQKYSGGRDATNHGG